MKLPFDGLQIIEYVGVIEFEIIQDGGSWRVVHKFGALIKEGTVVFVGLDYEEGRIADIR